MTATTTTPALGNPWLVRWPGRAEPALRLVGFPYAGGGTGIFRVWPPQLPGFLEVVAVRLPGRETRVTEPPTTSMAELAVRTAAAIAPLTCEPYVLFGHSLGALTAYETARELVGAGLPAPAALVVSALAAPRLAVPARAIYDLPEPDLLAHLRRYGGTPAQVLENRELLDLLLPTIRADFALLDTYRFRAGPALRCPLVALRGEQDATVSADEVRAWSAYTSGPSVYAEVLGGHFCITEHPGSMVARVVAALAELRVLPVPYPGPR